MIQLLRPISNCLTKQSQIQSSILRLQFRSYQEWKKSRPRISNKGGGNSRSKRNVDPKQRIVGRVSSVLDDPYVSQDRSKPIRERGKLSQPLVKLPKIEEDDNAELLAGDSDMIQTILNDALSIPKIASSIVPGVDDLCDIIEFEKTSLNRDASHVHVEWISSSLFQFYSLLLEKTLALPNTQSPPYTHQDLDRFESRITQLTRSLQDAEGTFRSEIIKKINFRKVPRIFFRCERDLLEVLKELREILRNNAEE